MNCITFTEGSDQLLTALSIYGDNEEMLCKWFKRTGKRDEIFLATKFGIVMENGKFTGVNSSAEYCKTSCAESLKRLGVDHIDLCKPSHNSVYLTCN